MFDQEDTMKKRTTIYIENDLFKQTKVYAAENESSISVTIEKALNEYLSKSVQQSDQNKDEHLF